MLYNINGCLHRVAPPPIQTIRANLFIANPRERCERFYARARLNGRLIFAATATPYNGYLLPPPGACKVLLLQFERKFEEIAAGQEAAEPTSANTQRSEQEILIDTVVVVVGRLRAGGRSVRENRFTAGRHSTNRVMCVCVWVGRNSGY